MCYKERLIQQLGMRVSGCLIKQFTDLLSIRVHNCIKLLTTTQCKVNICTRQQLSFPQYVNSLHILCKYGAEILPLTHAKHCQRWPRALQPSLPQLQQRKAPLPKASALQGVGLGILSSFVIPLLANAEDMIRS